VEGARSRDIRSNQGPLTLAQAQPALQSIHRRLGCKVEALVGQPWHELFG
jgi:hypothetical protein